MSGFWSALFVMALLLMTPILTITERYEIQVPSEEAQSESALDEQEQPNIFAIDPELLERATGSISAFGRNGLFWAEFTLNGWHFTDISIDKERLSNSIVELEIELDSLDSWVFWRLPHILGPDFLDAERYPVARVRLFEIHVENVNPYGIGKYQGQLELEVKGVVKTYPLRFDVTGRYPIRVEGELYLLRSDFGIGHKPHPLNIFAVQDQLVVKFHANIPDQTLPPGFPIFGDSRNRE